MNRRLLILVSFVLIFSACSKKPPSIPDPATSGDISPVPPRFSQNFLIEKFTSSFEGQSPKGDFFSDSLIRTNQGRVFCSAIHVNDLLTDTALITISTGVHQLDSLFNPSRVYPSGMVNRNYGLAVGFGPDGWGDQVQTGFGQVPQCGVALEAKNVNNGFLYLTVHVGFSSDLFGDYRIHGYIVENSYRNGDSLYDQLNDFSFEGNNPDPLLPYYSLNDTIHLYTYNYVLRKVFTIEKLAGDVIPASIMKSGNEFVKSYAINLNGINSSNCSVIVFVDKYATTPTGHRIINVQRVAIGESQDWN